MVREGMDAVGIWCGPRELRGGTALVVIRVFVMRTSGGISSGCRSGAMRWLRRAGGRVQKISLWAPRNAPLRTGRCRVRRLRSSFTIATFSGRTPAGERLKPACSRALPLRAGPRKRNEFKAVGTRRAVVQAFSAYVARFGHNYKRNERVKQGCCELAHRRRGLRRAAVDNFLTRVAEGRPEKPRLPDPAHRRGAASTRAASGRMRGSPSATSFGCRRCGRGAGQHDGARAPGAPAAACRCCSRTTHCSPSTSRPGLAVHGGSGIAHGLIEQLRAARPDARFLELVHRLDRDTSGVLLVAKKRAALVELHAQLRDGDIDKRYLVLVRGRWRDEKRRVRLALHKFATQGGERRVRVDDEGARRPRPSFAGARRGATAIRRWRCSRRSS